MEEQLGQVGRVISTDLHGLSVLLNQSGFFCSSVDTNDFFFTVLVIA